MIILSPIIYFVMGYKHFYFATLIAFLIYASRFVLRFTNRPAYDRLYGEKRGGLQVFTLCAVLFIELFVLTLNISFHDLAQYDFSQFKLGYYVSLGVICAIECSRAVTPYSLTAVNVITNKKVPSSQTGGITYYGACVAFFASFGTAGFYYYMNNDAVKSVLVILFSVLGFLLNSVAENLLEERVVTITLSNDEKQQKQKGIVGITKLTTTFIAVMGISMLAVLIAFIMK